MTNPAATLRMLITYGICIPLAIMAGYFLVNAVNAPTYGSLGILGVVIALLLTPIFIKNPDHVFGLDGIGRGNGFGSGGFGSEDAVKEAHEWVLYR